MPRCRWSKGGLGSRRTIPPRIGLMPWGSQPACPYAMARIGILTRSGFLKGDDPSRIVSRSPVGEPGVSLAVDPTLANEFAYRAGNAMSNTGQNVLPVFHRADSRAHLSLSGDKSNADIFGTAVDAWKQGKKGLLFDNYNIFHTRNK